MRTAVRIIWIMAVAFCWAHYPAMALALLCGPFTWRSLCEWEEYHRDRDNDYKRMVRQKREAKFQRYPVE
jgi:hypothetical protein